MAVIWSEIPEELVYMFVERLVCVDDLIRFGAVCKLWRTVSISQRQKKKAYAPLLMLANAENDKFPSVDGEGLRSFVIPYYRDGEEGANPKKMRSFDIELPKAQGRRCWGSPHGWVVTVGLDFNIGLLNPLTGEQLYLPSQTILQQQSLKSLGFSCTPHFEPDGTISLLILKFALDWHQPSKSWLVMAIFGSGEEVGFAFTKSEDPSSFSSWTYIDYTVDAEDVIFFQGRIYLIAYGGKLKVCDIEEGTPPKAIRIAPPPEDVDDSNTFYLVEIDGNLHFIARYYDPVEEEDEHWNLTTGFRVWRFDFSNTMWCKLDDLGENALFLGHNTSYAISTITYPDFSKNSIYFTDDRYTKYKSCCDMGVYDYKEKTVKPFHIANIVHLGSGLSILLGILPPEALIAVHRFSDLPCRLLVLPCLDVVF